jgi:hypothetical protein
MSQKIKNAWHEVRGATPEELKASEAETVRLYQDIIGLPRHVSSKHPPLGMESRAAQFLPFAALTGFHEAIKKTEEETLAQREK